MKRTLTALSVASFTALCAYSAPAFALEEGKYVVCGKDYYNLDEIVRIRERGSGIYIIYLSNGEDFRLYSKCRALPISDLPIME